MTNLLEQDATPPSKNIPHGYCQCDCGRKTSLITQTVATRGLVRGTYRRYIIGHHSRVDVKARFWSKVDKSDGCWIWKGNKTQEGYGHFKRYPLASDWPAHRVAYEFVIGPIAVGLQLHHTCRNKSCVNPEHLKPVTPAEHRRIEMPTHCKHGHEFDSENTLYGSSQRFCRTCAREREAKFRDRRRAMKQ